MVAATKVAATKVNVTKVDVTMIDITMVDLTTEVTRVGYRLVSGWFWVGYRVVMG